MKDLTVKQAEALRNLIAWDLWGDTHGKRNWENLHGGTKASLWRNRFILSGSRPTLTEKGRRAFLAWSKRTGKYDYTAEELTKSVKDRKLVKVKVTCRPDPNYERFGYVQWLYRAEFSDGHTEQDFLAENPHWGWMHSDAKTKDILYAIAQDFPYLWHDTKGTNWDIDRDANIFTWTAT